MLQVKNAIKDAIPMDSYRSWFLQDKAGFVEYAETSRGFLIVIAPTSFFRDTIKTRFLMQIIEAVKPLGFKYVEIIKAGDPLPTFQPRELEPEQWSELKSVLTKVGKFARSAGNHKASSGLFTPGIEEEIVETQKPKPKPSYVYTGRGGLGGFSPQNIEEQPAKITEEPHLGHEGVIFPVLIQNQAREEFYHG